MSTLIATGEKANLWSFNTKGIDKMLPFVCDKFIQRDDKDEPEIAYWAWDCDCGIYIYGNIEKIKNVFIEIEKFVTQKLDDEIVWDALVDSPTSYGLFKSKKQDVGVIIGAGSYRKTDPELIKLMNSFKDVKVGELGANYSNDDNFFTILMDDLAEGDGEKESKVLEMTIIQEVVKYYLKEDLIEKEDVDKFYSPEIKLFKKRQKFLKK